MAVLNSTFSFHLKSTNLRTSTGIVVTLLFAFYFSLCTTYHRIMSTPDHSDLTTKKHAGSCGKLPSTTFCKIRSKWAPPIVRRKPGDLASLVTIPHRFSSDPLELNLFRSAWIPSAPVAQVASPPRQCQGSSGGDEKIGEEDNRR